MIERGLTPLKKIKDFFQTTPLENLLPGSRREQMSVFLQKLLLGGFGFHGTSSLHWSLILTHGLDSKFAPIETHPSGQVNYFSLDLQTDPVLQGELSTSGIVATYYRMKNSINSAISYGEQQNFSIKHNIRSYGHGVATPLVVVFRAPEKEGYTAYKFGSDIPTRMRKDDTEILGSLPHRVVDRVLPNRIIRCFQVDSTRKREDFSEWVISELFYEIHAAK